MDQRINQQLINFLQEKLKKIDLPKDPRFGPGPSKISLDALQALYKTQDQFLGTGHRSQEFRDFFKEIQEGLLEYFSLDQQKYSVVMGNGGATFLFDMIPLGLGRKKSGHFTNGEFSKKWLKSTKNIPWI